MSSLTPPGFPPVPTAPAPTAPPVAVAPAAAAPAAIAPDQMALSAGPDPALLGQIQQKLLVGTPVEQAMAMYQLKAYAVSHRAHVVPMLIEQLQGGRAETNQRAAIDILTSIKAPEAAPYLQQIAMSGPTSLRPAATDAYGAITGQPLFPPPPPTPVVPPGGPQGTMPGTPGTPGTPGSPVTPGTTPGAPAPNRPLTTPTTPTTPTPPAPSSSDLANLTAQLVTPGQEPMAVVKLAQLPTDPMLTVVNKAVTGFPLSPKVMNLIVTMLAKRVAEPGVGSMLQTIIRQNRADMPEATAKAAMALMSRKDPAYQGDIFRALLVRNPAMAPIKRAIIDTLVKNPDVLKHPAAAVVFGAVLNANESPELAASASHALGLIPNEKARAALAASPLLRSPVPQLRYRALADLERQPLPYPQATMAQLQALARDPDPQVAQKAQQVLSKRA